MTESPVSYIVNLIRCCRAFEPIARTSEEHKEFDKS